MKSSIAESLLICVLLSALPASVRASAQPCHNLATGLPQPCPPKQQATNQQFLSKQPGTGTAGNTGIGKGGSGKDHWKENAKAPLNVIGLQLELREPSYEDVVIAHSVSHANKTVMSFVENTVRFTSMEIMANYLREDAGISWLTSYSNLTSCASSMECSTSWRTDPALGGENVTVIDVVRALDVNDLARCHLTSNETEAYCHLPMPGMDLGWAYFALAVPSNSNSSSPLPLAIVCHGYSASLMLELSAEKAAIAAKYPTPFNEWQGPGIYCHPMNGNSFLATDTGNTSDLQVSSLPSEQSVFVLAGLPW